MASADYVEVHGKKVRILEDELDLSGGILDYGKKLWWIEEEFPGLYALTPKDKAELDTAKNAELDFKYNGDLFLSLNGKKYKGRVDDIRRYAELATAILSPEEGGDPFTFCFDYYVEENLTENYERLEINIPDAPEEVPSEFFLTKKA